MLTIVYIASPGHSGSTLLDLLVSSHSQVTTIGEAKVLSPSRGRPVADYKCTCGAVGLRACAFWAAVEARLIATAGLTLDALDVESPDPQQFARHNLALFDSVATVSGRRIIVDSSKSPLRLERLLALNEVAVRPIQLRRAPSGVVYSNVKKGHSWMRHALAYGRHYRRVDRALRGRDAYRLQYESLAADPQATLMPLMAWLGLTFEPGQLVWRDQPHHSIAGNHMRLGSDRDIRVDQRWKTELSTLQRVGTAVLSRAGGHPADAWLAALIGKGRQRRER